MFSDIHAADKIRRSLFSTPQTRLVSTLFAVIGSLAAAGFSQPASAQSSNIVRQGNNVTVTCDGNFTPLQALCRDGNRCNSATVSNLSNPPNASTSNQDNITFTPAGTYDLTWEVTQISVRVSGTDSNNPVNFDITGPATSPATPALVSGGPQTFTQTGVTSNPPANTLNISIPNQPGFSVLQYRVKCTPQQGTLKINKVALGGSGTFPITATLGNTVVNYSVASGGSQSQLVAPGSYTIAETPPAGWVLESIVCSGGNSAGATAVVTAGQTTTCTVTNKKKGTVVIEKEAKDGDGATQFGFTGGLGAFSLTPGPNTTVSTTFSDVTPGSYSVTETAVANWTTTLSCSETATPANTTTASPTASIVVDPGETVTCRWVNTGAKGKIRIQKTTVNGNNATTFGFTGSGAIGNFNLTPTAGDPTPFQDFTLPAGNYSVTENALTPGWTLTSLTCTDPTGNTSTAGATANIALGVGETVTCVYQNTLANGSITIEKEAVNGDAATAFQFTGGLGSFSLTPPANGVVSQSFSQQPGAYTVTETAVPGWTTSVKCSVSGTSSATTTTNSATITLVGGSSVTCRFVNTRQPGTITIKKTSVSGDGTTPFTFTGSGTLGSFPLTPPANGSVTKVLNNVTAGSYTVTETPVAGWSTTVACDDPTGNSSPTSATAGNVANINLAPAEAVTCTFVNTKLRAALTIDKQTTVTKFSMVGEVIPYTYKVTNSGNAPVTQPISVVDDKIAGVVCPALPMGGLAPGGSITCTGSYTVTGADILAGSITNKAFAKSGDIVSNTDSVTVTRDDDKIRDKTRETIHNFLERRTDMLLSAEPDRARIARKMQGTLWGDGGCNQIAGGAAGMGSQVSANHDQGNTRVALATSWSQLQADAANRRKADEANRTAGLGDDRPGMTADQATGEQATGKRFAIAPAADDRMGLGRGHELGHGSLKDEPAECVAAPQHRLDVWVEAHYARYVDDYKNVDRNGRFGIIYAGVDYLVTPAILVGALVQWDSMEDDTKSTGTFVKGTGWMAGPYLSAQLSKHLMFDARAAWGRSDNSVNPLGIYVDEFDTTRWLARANLTGNWQSGAWRFTPSASIAYIEERQHAYTDTLGNFIPGQTVSLGRVTFGPEVAYRFQANDGTWIEPHVSLTGIWDFDKTGQLTFGNVVVSPDEFRARVEAGVQFRTPGGFALRASAAYDGIGSDDFHAWSGKLWISAPLD